jgi:dTDP-4-amino-4,6-dideoxygalactose transaminase
MSTYKGRPLGSIGHLGCLSFHETKNIISGEGGALLVNDPALAERAEIIREKGTNRCQFFRGQVDKYSWIDIGSSYLPSELVAAFLWAQMEEADLITQRRLDLWAVYHRGFASLERDSKVQRPVIPVHCNHNAHMYYLLLPDLESRSMLIEKLRSAHAQLVFHYVPLHSATAGLCHGRAHGQLANTDRVSERLVRLPMWIGLEADQSRVVDNVCGALQH